MRKRLAAAGLGVILGTTSATAQQFPPQPAFPVAPPSQPLPQIPPPQFPVQPPRTPTAPVFPVAPPVSTQPQSPVAPQFPVAPVQPGLPGGFPGPLAPPSPPQTLPPALLSPGAQPGSLPGTNPTGSPAGEVPLPYAEQKLPISALDVSVKRVVGGWQVWAGQRMLRDLGGNETDARDLARAIRDLHPTEWVVIGGAKPVVEYGLTNGRPAVAGAAVAADPKTGTGQGNAPNTGSAMGGSQLPVAPVGFSGGGPAISGAGAKVIQPIDLRTARVEPIRGVWCVRDDDNLLFNFGTDKAGAEQTIAVIRKYGFNRVGIVGSQTQPVMSYLFVSLEPERQKPLGGPLLMNAQIDALSRTGIPVPGVGFTGEMIKIDPRKVEARRDGAEWVVASGSEVLGRFGPTEWAAREAARTVRDAKFTEFCKLGGASGMTFFLRDGKPPTRAPFSTQGRNFDLSGLKVQQINDRWAVTEGNRHLFDVGSPQEGETVIRVLKAYGFDQTARLSAGGPKGGIMFFVKSR